MDYQQTRSDVSVLLIEKAASGFAVASELQRLYAQDGIAVHLLTPKGDKVARCHAIVPILAQGLVHAPNISWSDDLLHLATRRSNRLQW
jgi:phage terminase large subunit-like protein